MILQFKVGCLNFSPVEDSAIYSIGILQAVNAPYCAKRDSMGEQVCARFAYCGLDFRLYKTEAGCMGCHTCSIIPTSLGMA